MLADRAYAGVSCAPFSFTLMCSNLAAKLTNMANQFIRSVTVGIKRRWSGGLKIGLACVGGAWTVTELLTAALPPLKQSLEAHGADYLIVMAALFAGAFISYVVEPSLVSFKIPLTDTKITLKYGDLFREDADLLIGVNELFDGELGVPVSKNTVHGQMLVRSFGGSAAAFRAAVDPVLQATGLQPTTTTRTFQPKQAYPIGTTIRIPDGAHCLFLMAMTRTDVATSKASADVPTLWCALKSALQVVHDQGNGEPIAMPLFGNGQAGVKLEPQNLLRLLILTLVDFATNSAARLPKQVTVVLHETCFEALDIREIARDWKK